MVSRYIGHHIFVGLLTLVLPSAIILLLLVRAAVSITDRDDEARAVLSRKPFPDIGP